MRWLVALSVLALIACGGGDDDDGDSGLSDAEDRIEAAVETFVKNQAGRTYDEFLLPSQRAEIDRDLFIECNTGSAGSDAEIEIDESYTETVTVPTIGEVETAAVTYTMSANDRSVANTSHAVEVDGEWYVFFPQATFDTYAAGDCP